MGGYGLTEASDIMSSCNVETPATCTSLLEFIHKSFQNKKGLQRYKKTKFASFVCHVLAWECVKPIMKATLNIMKSLRYQK